MKSDRSAQYRDTPRVTSLLEFPLIAGLVFCRIGGCLMFVPGFSHARIPMRIRLFLAIAIALALSPVLSLSLQPALNSQRPASALMLMFSETATGALMGLAGRMFFLALETFGMMAATAIGMTGTFGISTDSDVPLPPLASMVMAVVTLLVLTTDLHRQIIIGLVQSYDAMPPMRGFGEQFALIQIADTLSASFLVTLRLMSPFIIYAVAVNFAFGLVNRVAPQVPIYFVVAPLVLLGGIYLLVLIQRDLIAGFIDAFGASLTRG